MSAINGKTSSKTTLRYRLIAAAALILSAAFVLFSPRYYEGRLHLDPYRQWLIHEREPSVGVISVWHIVGFKPYAGSLGTWLETRAKKYSHRYIGIHFEVTSLSHEEAEERMERGVHPDIISFAEGSTPYSDLMPLGCAESDHAKRSGCVGETQYALPYCATGKVLICAPNAMNGMGKDELIGTASTLEEYRNGKADHCITDIRGAGDLTRAQLMGKEDPFEIIPLPEADYMVQYVGLYRTVDEVKIPYAKGFIEYIVSGASQELISELGLIAVFPKDGAGSDIDWLNELQNGLDPLKFKGAF